MYVGSLCLYVYIYSGQSKSVLHATMVEGGRAPPELLQHASAGSYGPLCCANTMTSAYEVYRVSAPCLRVRAMVLTVFGWME